ncbi:hypothetical protein [Streptacidiphilus albus]|jgi:hypothetical protein|nr:hypothetical protein [Streptacidiphilus albus]
MEIEERQWIAPAMSAVVFEAQLECACRCGASAGSGGGSGGEVI